MVYNYMLCCFAIKKNLLLMDMFCHVISGSPFSFGQCFVCLSVWLKNLCFKKLKTY